MVRPPRIEPSGDVVARVATAALALPDAYEEDAWTGVRWRVRSRTFAHVLVAQEGYTSAYRDLTGVTAPTTVLTFRSTGDELLALTNAGRRSTSHRGRPRSSAWCSTRALTGTRSPSW